MKNAPRLQSGALSLRGFARLIDRSPATISRELRRNRDAGGHYSASTAQQRRHARRRAWVVLHGSAISGVQDSKRSLLE
ncbi:hypothetical protein BH596_23605 [Pseudomonas aeruginosa]|nr:hypothetical protein BH596_23605 [Pseudomonas aeruginosa]